MVVDDVVSYPLAAEGSLAMNLDTMTVILVVLVVVGMVLGFGHGCK